MHPTCPDFDLCADCEAHPIAIHPVIHPLLKIKSLDTVIPNTQPPQPIVVTQPPVLIQRGRSRETSRSPQPLRRYTHYPSIPVGSRSPSVTRVYQSPKLHRSRSPIYVPPHLRRRSRSRSYTPVCVSGRPHRMRSPPPLDLRRGGRLRSPSPVLRPHLYARSRSCSPIAHPSTVYVRARTPSRSPTRYDTRRRRSPSPPERRLPMYSGYVRSMSRSRSRSWSPRFESARTMRAVYREPHRHSPESVFVPPLTPTGPSPPLSPAALWRMSPQSLTILPRCCRSPISFPVTNPSPPRSSLPTLPTNDVFPTADIQESAATSVAPQSGSPESAAATILPASGSMHVPVSIQPVPLLVNLDEPKVVERDVGMSESTGSVSSSASSQSQSLFKLPPLALDPAADLFREFWPRVAHELKHLMQDSPMPDAPRGVPSSEANTSQGSSNTVIDATKENPKTVDSPLTGEALLERPNGTEMSQVNVMPAVSNHSLASLLNGYQGPSLNLSSDILRHGTGDEAANKLPAVEAMPVKVLPVEAPCPESPKALSNKAPSPLSSNSPPLSSQAPSLEAGSAKTPSFQEKPVLRSLFLRDNTVPDGQIFPPGAEFVKSWRMLNDGDCDWPESTELVFATGDSLSRDLTGPQRIKIGSVPAGKEVNVWTGELKVRPFHSSLHLY